MSSKLLKYAVLFFLVMLVLYAVTSTAANVLTPASPASSSSSSSPSTSAPGYWSKLFKSVNDLSYNVLFGWWMK